MNEENAVKGSDFDFTARLLQEVQKLRVAAQVRETHLAKREVVDITTGSVKKKLLLIEEELNEQIREFVRDHPAYDWFSKIKGVGDLNIGKILGYIDIEKAPSVSSLWKYAGYHVEDGKGPKRHKGQKNEFNADLRMMCWRLATSLTKGKGKFYELYLSEKGRLVEKYTLRGVKVVKATDLPKRDGKMYEPEDMISEGHVHNQALRKMTKIFLSCLWQVWREAEGLPTRVPYSAEYLGHTHIIDAWSMIDEKKTARKARG